MIRSRETLVTIESVRKKKENMSLKVFKFKCILNECLLINLYKRGRRLIIIVYIKHILRTNCETIMLMIIITY